MKGKREGSEKIVKRKRERKWREKKRRKRKGGNVKRRQDLGKSVKKKRERRRSEKGKRWRYEGERLTQEESVEEKREKRGYEANV